VASTCRESAPLDLIQRKPHETRAHLTKINADNLLPPLNT
jgi:hypothetical protein